jgi:hypothetical protein
MTRTTRTRMTRMTRMMTTTMFASAGEGEVEVIM